MRTPATPAGPALARVGQEGASMTAALPTCPPIQRRSMTPQPWAGTPWLRPLRRLIATRPSPVPRLQKPGRPRMRRLVLLTLVLGSAWLGTEFMMQVLPEHGADRLEQVLLALFALLFGWISAGFWTALMGAALLLRGPREHDRDVLRRREAINLPIPADARTAIVMPICNEDVSAVFGNLRATIDSLRQTGSLERFDVFVLSDTNDPDLRVAEQLAYAELRAVQGEQGAKVYYRWRQQRTKRKAGNVADFCRRWGSLYRYMVVLDADSVMTGACLTTLVRLMEANPDAGILQTAPVATGHTTLHARLQQFGSRLYGPVFTAGMSYWQLGESHYWGHNAILRLAPFIEHCGLAPLPGRGSLSGEVMSHDFVEAALMRRAGWKVCVLHDLPGSYEQVPPNLDTELQRERRWCQGNLQNSRLMFEPGLHPVHRSVFLTGLLSYLSSPLWLAFLLASSLLFAHHVGDVPTYFLTPYQLFPIWPTHDTTLVLTLFGLTAALLLAPKLFALVVVMVRGEAAQYGGVLRMVLSACGEFVYGMLLAPVRMMFHTRFVLGPLLGLHSGWISPPRDNAVTTLGQAWRRHGLHTVLALAWITGLLAAGSTFPWWMSPVIGGLLLGAPMAALGSRARLGLALRRAGFLLTPEERKEPAALRAARRYAADARAVEGMAQVVAEPPLHDALRQAGTLRLSPARGLKAQAGAALLERALREGLDSLSRSQRLRLAGDGRALAGLARQGPHAR
jgi:membrane glycosyltransferase